MDKVMTIFRSAIGCFLPALLLASYLADVFLVVDPATSVLPLFTKDLIRLTIFGIILGIAIHQITERFDLTLFRYYPLFGMIGYFVLNGLNDIFRFVQSGKELAQSLPEITNNIIPALFLGAGFGVLYWVLAVQKSGQIALMVSLIILITSLFYIKEIVGLFLI